MGAVGYWVSERAVFVLAAVLVVPAFAALRMIEAPGAGWQRGPPTCRCGWR